MDLFKKSRKKDGKKVDTKAGDGSDTDPSRPSTPQRQAKASGSGSEIRKFFSRSPRASKKVISDQTFEADVTDVAKSPIEPTHVDRNDEDPNDIPELTLFVFDPKTNFWQQAIESLNIEYKSEDWIPDEWKPLERDGPQLLTVVVEARDDCLKRQWGVKIAGTDVKLREVLRKIVNWVKKFVPVGDTAVQFDPVHAALPWAGFRFLLQVIVNELDLYDGLLEGLERVSWLISYTSIHERHFRDYYANISQQTGSGNQFTTSLVSLYKDILKLLYEAHKFYQKSVAARVALSITETGTWLTNAMKTVKDAKSCMEDHAQLLFRENIHDKLKKILDSLNDVQSRQKDDDRYTFLQSISGIQCSVHHKKNFTGVLQDTGNWLLEDPDFITWKESNSVLWLHGIPGSGKTKLTAILIDHLIKEDHRVAYFYCIRDTKEQERADPVEILRAILRQLVSLIPDELFDDDSVVKQCVKEREETKKKGEKPSAPDQDQCVKWILQLTTQYSTTIVIDALDECDNHTRHHLFKALTTIVKPQSLVRIFVSSRDDQDIVQHLNGRKNIRIDASKNTEDIRRFVQNEIKVAIDEKRLLRGNVKQELKELIIDKLQNSAQGMFLWVTLQIAALCDQRRINTANAVKQRLDTMPEPLSTLYAEIYEEIMQNFDFPAIKAMLLWLLYSQRQLSSKEVVAITSISTSSEDITPQTILSLCRNLITLDQATNSFTFAHLSVREFLEKREEFNAAVGHATIVMSCFEFFTTPNTSQVQQILHYASLYWPQHYQDYQKVTDNNLQNEEVRKAASILLSNRNPDGGLSTWASVGKKAINSLAWYDGLQEEWKDASFEPFRTTCVFGLPDLVEHCLHSGEQPRDIEYGLYMAVKWNNERVACLVLERLVKLNNVKINLQVLFLAAIQLGMMDAASAMSSREAVLHVGGDAHWTLLHWMVIFRSESGITHLLANRARCNEKDLDGRTPLHFAAMAGYQKGLQLLLEAGARVDMKDDAGWSPWHWAAFMKQNDTIELLNTDQDGNETSSRDHFLSLIMVVVFILKLHEHC